MLSSSPAHFFSLQAVNACALYVAISETLVGMVATESAGGRGVLVVFLHMEKSHRIV